MLCRRSTKSTLQSRILYKKMTHFVPAPQPKVLSAPKELGAHIWTADASLIIFSIFRKKCRPNHHHPCRVESSDQENAKLEITEITVSNIFSQIDAPTPPSRRATGGDRFSDFFENNQKYNHWCVCCPNMSSQLLRSAENHRFPCWYKMCHFLYKMCSQDGISDRFRGSPVKHC